MFKTVGLLNWSPFICKELNCVFKFLLIFSSCFRKQCINETEEFDFLKDIVANVEDTPVVVSVQSEETKVSDEVNNNGIEENPAVITIHEDEGSKTLNHKCSISTMLNDEPVTPPHNRTKDIDLSEGHVPVSDNTLNETSS